MVDAGDFGDVERTFTTSKGERISKVETQRGGTLFYSEQTGQINQQEYATKSGQRREPQIFRQEDISGVSVDDLSQRYQTEATMPIGDLPPGSIEREKTKQQNMFVGFLLQDDTPDDRIRAVQDYEEMQQRLRQADSHEDIEDIKQDYNIGGTP